MGSATAPAELSPNLAKPVMALSVNGLGCVSSRTGAILVEFASGGENKVDSSNILDNIPLPNNNYVPWDETLGHRRTGQLPGFVGVRNHRALARMPLKIRYIYKISRSMLS